MIPRDVSHDAPPPAASTDSSPALYITFVLFYFLCGGVNVGLLSNGNNIFTRLPGMSDRVTTFFNCCFTQSLLWPLWLLVHMPIVLVNKIVRRIRGEGFLKPKPVVAPELPLWETEDDEPTLEQIQLRMMVTFAMRHNNDHISINSPRVTFDEPTDGSGSVTRKRLRSPPPVYTRRPEEGQRTLTQSDPVFHGQIGVEGRAETGGRLLELNAPRHSNELGRGAGATESSDSVASSRRSSNGSAEVVVEDEPPRGRERRRPTSILEERI